MRTVPFPVQVAVAAGLAFAGTLAVTATQDRSSEIRALVPGACKIKGNISLDGERIYHVPGQRYYNATVIDTSTGERWFCSEADAQAAGWRRSRV